MKKLGILLACTLVLFATGCQSTKGEYQEGVYEAEAIDTYGGEENTATAKITVDEDGMITKVELDTTYTKDGELTTKKELGSDYGMKGYSASLGNIEGGGEWFEQAKALEDAIVENQGVDFLELSEDGKTDAVSGCTMSISSLVEAATTAIEEAK